MTRQEFIKAVSELTGDSQKKTKEIVEAMQSVAYAEMAAEGEVKIFDGVTLSGVHKNSTIARNPMTGAAVTVPEKTAPKCKFGKAVKDALNA